MSGKFTYKLIAYVQKAGVAVSWIEDISKAIKYIEEHITDDLCVDNIADQVNLSPYYFQKGFSILCGFTVAEYIRNRRLSLAGRDLQLNGSKGGVMALLGRCVYFLPIGVLSYLHFNKAER